MLDNLSRKSRTVLLRSVSGSENTVRRHDASYWEASPREELIFAMCGATERISAGQWYHVSAMLSQRCFFEPGVDEIELCFDGRILPNHYKPLLLGSVLPRNTEIVAYFRGFASPIHTNAREF